MPKNEIEGNNPPVFIVKQYVYNASVLNEEDLKKIISACKVMITSGNGTYSDPFLQDVVKHSVIWKEETNKEPSDITNKTRKRQRQRLKQTSNNKENNESRIMNKKNRIRLTESQLNNIIRRVVNESISYGNPKLPEIIEDMASYVRQCIADGEDVQGYFSEITRTGLFHDACGKVTNFDSRMCTVDTEY